VSSNSGRSLLSYSLEPASTFCPHLQAAVAAYLHPVCSRTGVLMFLKRAVDTTGFWARCSCHVAAISAGVWEPRRSRFGTRWLDRGRRPKSDYPCTDVSGGTRDTDYQTSITNRRAVATLNGAFCNRSTTSTPHAAFDASVDRINSYGQGSSASGYTVRAGETLASIAANLWGDSSLWYRLAEANGLSGSAALSEGQSIRIPAGVLKNTHNASTFKPFDPAETIGDTSPTTPKPPK
jgi:hypothetical protein